MKYRKKPVEIEAVKFNLCEWADNPATEAFDEVPEWLREAYDNETLEKNTIHFSFRSEDYWYCVIQTLEGEMTATPGDYIIQGVKGELYPCKPDIFDATYERVTDE